MELEAEAAEAYYRRTLDSLAEQHRYVAQAQLEAAARQALIPVEAAEVAWAKGCLDSARGLPVDWQALRAQKKQAQEQFDEDYSRIRVAGRPWLLVDSE